jgi:predicted outer membrane repeat protein
VITGGNADRKKWPDDGGGGMNNHNGSPTIINCLFEKNHCFADGGGMRNWGDAEPRIIQTVFRENRSEQEGGGMMNGPDSRTLVLNCRFIRNHSAEDGGGIYNNETKPHYIMNCLFLHNTAALTGGALYHVNYSQTKVVNCTFTLNEASEAGGAVSNRDSHPVLVNCILWENQAPEHAEINNLRSEPSVSYSNVSGGYRGANNMNEDPAFANGYELSANSPCIDRGKNEAVPDHIRLDLNLQDRISNEIVDLGAFEYNDK